MRIKLKIAGAALLLAASAGLAAAQTVPPGTTVSRPDRAAVSPKLSDLPPAAWKQSPQDLKVAPAPKALPPHGAGPGAAGSGEGVEQRQPGPDTGIQPKPNFG